MTPYLWIFAIFDGGALVLVACELFARPQLPAPSRDGLSPVVAVTGLVATYAVELLLTTYVAVYQVKPPAQPVFVPLPPIAGAIPHFDVVAGAMLALAATQTALLLALYRRPPGARLLAAGAAVMLGLAFCSPVLLSGDVYAYIGDGLLGLQAYAPPAARFPGELGAINAWWGVPLPRSVYGPLWIAVVAAATAPLPSLLGKFLALRAIGAAGYGGLLVVLHALRAPRRMLAVAALNPAILFNYVTNAHNDLFGIVLVLFAALAMRARPAVAFALMLAGALVKLPFAIFALPLSSALRSNGARIAFCIGVPALAAAVTWLAGGRGFLAAAVPHVASGGIALIATAAAGVVAFAALLVAAFGGRRLRSVVLLVPLVTAYTCAWYLAWSLPYALPRHRVLGYLLIGFPLAAAALDVKFMRPWSLFFVVPALVAWQALELRGSKARARA